MTAEQKSTEQSTTEAIEKLTESMQQLDSRLSKLTSYKQSFGLYVTRGIAFTIGASIIAGVVIAFSAQFIQSVEDVPVLNKLVDTVIIQEVLNQYEMSQQNGGL